MAVVALCVLFTRRKAFGQAMPWGWTPHLTSSSLEWLVRGEYCCLLSNLGSSLQGESLCYWGPMLSQVWYSHLHLEPSAGTWWHRGELTPLLVCRWS